MVLQLDEVTNLLNKESVTAIGLLLTICALLIWDKVRQEKRYESLLDKYEKEQEDNKTILIDLVQKSILATEKNTQAINTIRDVYRDRA